MGGVPPYTLEESRAGGDNDTRAIGNWTEFIDEQINHSYVSTSGKSRLGPYLRATNIPPFIINDDRCVTNEEVQIAQSIILSIQSRIQRFFMNALPLARVYPHWNSLGATKLVSDYLARKIYSELDQRELVNLMYDKIEIIKKVFSDVPENDLELDNSLTPFQFIKVLVEKIYVGMLSNISEKSAYSNLSRSPYSPGTTNDRYKATLIKFFNELARALSRGGRGAGAGGFGLTRPQRLKASRFIRSNLVIDFNGEDLLTPKGYLYGTYYFPMAFLHGLYLITYDTLVNITRNFESGYLRTIIEIASADDSLLSSLAGQNINKYIQQVEMFPIKESTWQNIGITYFTREQVLDRIASLTFLEENEPAAILLREYPDFFRRYGSRDLPRQIAEVLGSVLFWIFMHHALPRTEIIKERLEQLAPRDGDHRIGETTYPAHAALMLLDEIESRNLRTLEDVVPGGLEDITSIWVSNPIRQQLEGRKQILVEKSRLEALLRI